MLSGQMILKVLPTRLMGAQMAHYLPAPRLYEKLGFREQ